VKCSHGATIGRLNEEEQFYMRSRGISLEDARVLQMISFIAPVLETIEDAQEREDVRSRFEESIRDIIK
jgi:Fe-S cluster assembly protein SufD